MCEPLRAGPCIDSVILGSVRMWALLTLSYQVGFSNGVVAACAVLDVIPAAGAWLGSGVPGYHQRALLEERARSGMPVVATVGDGETFWGGAEELHRVYSRMGVTTMSFWGGHCHEPWHTAVEALSRCVAQPRPGNI